MAESKLMPYIRGGEVASDPVGLTQTNSRLATRQDQYESGQSKLAPWMPQDSQLETAKSWYAGANSQGTSNGWDTNFYRNAFSQYDQWQQKAMDSKRGSTFYGWLDPNVNKQATGVQTWGADPNDEGAKARGEGRFGDIYNNGQKVGNLYDDHDQATADVLAGEFLFTNDDKARMFSNPDARTRQAEYRERVEQVRKENTDRFLYSRSAEDYQANVERTEREYQQGWQNEGTILGSAAASAAAGAGIGATLTAWLGPGAALGATAGGIIGGVAGLVGGYLNQDQLTEMAARSAVKADIANQTFSDDWLKRATMQIGEYSQLGQKFISPVSNIVQGVADDKVGDMTSGFYKVDAEGNREISGFIQGADIVASLADGILRFGSPVGIWMDRATLGGVVLGKTGELTTGTVFNDRRGQFDELETWQEKTSAIASVGIDAVQMGTVGAFAKATQSSRALYTGTKGVNAQSVSGRGILGRTNDTDWLTGKVDDVYGKLRGKELGDRAVTANGMRFQVDEAGNALNYRITTQMLVPSEFLRWIPAGYQARKLARMDGGEMTADHLLQASTSMLGNSRFRDAVLLGYAEGGEEFVQSWLDPARTGDKASWGDAWTAYLYGAAGGAGMALGPMGHKANTKQQLQAQAYVQHSMRTGTFMNDEEWATFTKGWSDKDFEKLARSDSNDSEKMKDVLAGIADQQRQDTAYHSSLGYAKLEAVKMTRWEQLLNKALEQGNGSLVLLGQTSEFLMTPDGRTERNKFAANHGVTSAREAVAQIGLIAQGHHAQLNEVRSDLQDVANRLKQDPTNEHLTTLQQEMTAREAELARQVVVSDNVADIVLGKYEAFAAERDPAMFEPMIEDLNETIKAAYAGTLDPNEPNRSRKAVEMKLARHPMMDRGGWSLLVPQISVELTKMNAENTMYLQQGMLKALGGDHDGDTKVPQHHVWHSDADLERMRRGDQYLQPMEDKDGKAIVEVIADAPDGEWAFMEAFKDAMLVAQSNAATTVTQRLDGLRKAIEAEFSAVTGGPIESTKLDSILDTFVASVQAGREDSRKNLVESMVNANYEGFLTHANSEGVPNVQWIWAKISETWDGLQKDLAYQRATSPTSVPISEGREASETSIRSEIARQDAATAGATLGMLATDPVRGAQFLHYSALFRSLTQIEYGEDGTISTPQQIELTELFNELGNGQTAKDIELITGRNAIEERVYYWLGQMANSVQLNGKTPPEVLLLLANMSVPSASLVAGTTNQYEVDGGSITMLQLLLRRSLDIEQAKHFAAPEDSDIAKKIKKLRRLTKRDPDLSKHSATPSMAMIEVMGSRPLHELVGKASAYISPQITLNQMIGQVRGLRREARSDEIERLKRQPSYIKNKDREIKDPPWPASVLTDPDTQISAFAMLVDAVKTAGDSYVPNMKQRDQTVHEDLIRGLEGLQATLSAHRTLHAKELGRVTTEADRIRVLRHALANDPRLASDIVLLIPDAAALGVFELRPDNSVTAAKWLERMLVTENAEQAAATYYFNLKIAEFNQLSGTVNLAHLEDLEDDERKKAIELGDVRGGIVPEKLKSRFHQVLYNLASQSDSIELLRFLKTMNEATSVADMFTAINNDPSWRNDQADLLPYHDDVSLFEIAPEDAWTGQMDGALHRENLRDWGRRMQIRGAVAVESEASYQNNLSVLHGMDQWRKTQGTAKPKDLNGGSMYYGLLKRALENRRKFPDTQGQAVRDQIIELQQVGLAQTQNKGKADPKAAPFGEASITLDSFGYADPLRQEMNALTAEDVDSVMTNLTLLVDAPVRIMHEDGSYTIFDITSEDRALDMLMDPMTQGLAMSILFPTVRDVNDANITQVYLDTDAKAGRDNLGNLAQMLREQTNAHLFTDYSEHGDRLRQAHRYIGSLESYVRKDAHENPNQTKGSEQFYPLQQALHDFIAVYTHSKDLGEDAKYTRESLFIDLADAIKAVAAVDPKLRPRLQEVVVGVMEKRFMKDSTRLATLLDDDVSKKAFLDLQANAKQFEKFQEVLDEFDTREAAAPDQAARDAIMVERKEFLEETQLLSGNYGRPRSTFLNAASALSMFSTASTGGPHAYAKTEILMYLGKNNRIHTLDKKGKLTTEDGTKINRQALYHKAVRMIYNDPLQTTQAQVTEQEWEVLASWAAELYMMDTTTRGSSSIPASGNWLGDDGEALRRYNDQSFSYLTDILFDEKLLEGADLLSQSGTHYAQRSSKDVATYLTDGLLSEAKIGTWTPVIVSESMKARMVLKNSPVGAAVASEGDDPKVMADFVGAGKVTWERPEPGHFNVIAMQGGANQRFPELLTTPMAQVSLDNHFVTSVIIQSADPSTPLDPALADALSSVTSVNHTSPETIAAGQITGPSPSSTGALRVLDLHELDARIEWLKSNGHLVGDYTVEIKYVDVNKKPFERKWANNIFFDGVGREAVGGSGMGAIASLFFGLGALNKIGQQNPLDMATKKGMGFKAWRRSRLEKAEQIEAGGLPIAQVMAAKAEHWLAQKYPMGELLRADLPSLYKLAKMRHVVVGVNAAGEKTVMWAEEAIAYQEAGLDLPLQDGWKLVPLSESVSQTLWGGSGSKGVKGTRGAMIEPTFHIQDLDIFPDLSPTRLEELGLSRIGDERKDIGNTRLAQVNVPPRAVATYDRGKTYSSLYKKRLLEWRGETQKVNQARAMARATGSMNIPNINRANAQLIIDMLSIETQSITATKLGIPEQGIVDMAALQVSRQIARGATRLMETDNAMIWVYRHGLGGDQTQGYIGLADIANNFSGMGETRVTFGDVVVIDLDDILNSTDRKNNSEALKAASKVVKELSKRGVTIALQSSSASQTLRSAVIEDMNSGRLGYRPMSESHMFFVPITEDADYNAAQRAYESTLLETEQVYSKNIAFGIVSDDISTDLTEATQWVDGEHDRAYTTVSHTLLPYMMTSTGSVGRRNPIAFGIPERGQGRADQLGYVNSQILELMNTPEGMAYLKELLGPENSYPKYRENPNGTIEHGVLTIDDALAQLKATAQSGEWPLDPTKTFYWGTIVPFISGDKSIHFVRIGFKQPSDRTMRKQRQLTFDDKQLKITASSTKLDAQQTLPPPTTVEEIKSDDKGISVRGTYEPGDMSKIISEGIGLKSGLAWLPKGWKFPDRVIKAAGAAGMRVTRVMGSTSVVGKEAKGGLVKGFREGFAVSGISFKDDMVEFLFGEDAGRSAEEQARLWDLAKSVLDSWADQPPRYTAAQLSRILDDRSAMVLMEARFNAIGRSTAPDTWQDISLRQTPNVPVPPNARLGQIILTTLAAPGVRLEHVIETAGFTTVKDLDTKSLVRFMPALMTDALNDTAHPDLREMLIGRMNRNMPMENGKHVYWFDNELKFHARMTQEHEGGSREEEVVGWLHITVPVPADENAIRLTYAGIDSKGKESKHVADVTAEATGGRPALKARPKSQKDLPTPLQEMYGQNEIARFEDEETAPAELYYMLTRMREHGEAYNPWNQRTPMEETALDDQRQKMAQYIYLGERTKETGWSVSQVKEGQRLATGFLASLNITDPKAVAEVEYLVRQMYAIPGPATGQEDYTEHLSFEVFQAGILAMDKNRIKGMHLLEGGFIPMEHSTFWKMLFDAQQGLPASQQYLPLANGNKKNKTYATADDWGSWVNALMGQVRASDKAFNSRFRADLDGFYNTYQGAHPDYAEMAVSLDQQVNAKLLDPETNRPYVSMDPGRDSVLKDPILLASKHLQYDALVGKGTALNEIEAEESSGSVMSKRIKAVEDWQRASELPKQKDMSVKEYVLQGAAYQESQRTTSNAMRNMVNGSIIMRLFNPALYFSAMFEVPFRSALEGATNVLTGQLTGRRGKAVAGLGGWLEDGLNAGDDQWWLTKMIGLDGVQVTPRFDKQEIDTLGRLNRTMGESNRFLALVYGELAYQTVIGGGRGKLGEKLEAGAAAVARMTADPKMGMKADALAKRYNDAVWEHLVMTNSQITMDQYAWEMQNDPTFIEREFPTAHRMGVNAVQQARGAKPTWVGNGIMKPITHWTSSENGFVNGAGHLIKIPFLFTRFNANMFMTLSGLTGIDQMAAMFFDGRQKPGLIKRLDARSKMEEGMEPTPEYWENSDVIEAIDLSRAFVRGAVTQTGLMAMAMLAGGFSLGGEDEEERKRKRMATYLNTPYYHDPRKASNDWRWKDAIFLDNVPILGNIFQNSTGQEGVEGRSAVVPHWIFRQFLSPVLGMMRFFETGNIAEIGYGFEDAVAVWPNSVKRLWNEATMTTQLLAETAQDDEIIAEKQGAISQLMTNIVFVYEKALFENAFINSLYQARDEYDRNPWAIPLLEEGNTNRLQREQGTGQPIPTTALQGYQTDQNLAQETSNRVGYATRNGTDAMLHQYTEGNATAAVMLSILPWMQGQDSTFLRGNMVTKRQKVQVDSSTADEVEALMMSTYMGRGGQDSFTKEEIIGAIKQREQAAGRFWDQAEVEAEADETYARISENPLTIFSDGAEQMTLEGKEAVFRSLRDGVVDLDNPAIAGFHATQDERDAIAERLTTALVQEGVDAGLSEQSAMYRMRRIWFGDATNPGAPGLREILYDKRISDKTYVEYDQLNVTYVLGPDGKPWATPFSKATVLQSFGIPVPHTMERPKPGMGLDARGNSVDLVRGINTGQAALSPRPVAVDIEANDSAVEKAQAKSYSPGGNSGGYRSYGRRGYGGGGYSSGGYGPGFQKMWNLPYGTSARVDGLAMINTATPNIRRSNVRRERISSERGRLKQWQ